MELHGFLINLALITIAKICKGRRMRASLIQKPCNSVCHIWKPIDIFGTEGVLFISCTRFSQKFYWIDQLWNWLHNTLCPWITNLVSKGLPGIIHPFLIPLLSNLYVSCQLWNTLFYCEFSSQISSLLGIWILNVLHLIPGGEQYPRYFFKENCF